MDDQEKLIVGKKGEIFLKKPLRETSGIHPGDEILIKALPGELIIKKVCPVNDLLKMPIIAEGTAEEIEKDIEEEGKEEEKLIKSK